MDPKELVDLEVDEVSLVDRGANRKRFLIVKRSGGKNVDPKEAENATKWLEAETVVQWLGAEEMVKYLDAETTKWLETEAAFKTDVTKWLAAEADPEAANKADAQAVAARLQAVVQSLQEAIKALGAPAPAPAPPPFPPAKEAEKIEALEKSVNETKDLLEKLVAYSPVRKSILGQDPPPAAGGDNDPWPSVRLPSL